MLAKLISALALFYLIYAQQSDLTLNSFSHLIKVTINFCKHKFQQIIIKYHKVRRELVWKYNDEHNIIKFSK